MKILSFIIVVFVFFISCRDTDWTEKRKRDFEEKCTKTDTVNGLNCSLTGFDYDEIENVEVLQIHNGQIVDSFYVQPNKNSFDPIRKRYSANIDKPLCIKDTFQFIIKGCDTFILSGMRMIMWEQFTMMSESYGCVMGDYQINGVRFEHNANPDFIKKGSKFSQEE